MKNQKESFITKDIGTAAALLATNKVKFLRTEHLPNDRKTIIHLIPKDAAEELFRQLLQAELTINASQNAFWVSKLKEVIFTKERNQE